MLKKLEALNLSAEGRYAADMELQFFYTYLPTMAMRFRAYQKIQAAEKAIIQQVLTEMMAIDENLLRHNGDDMTAKWQRDTVRVLRYAALALLTDDTALFKERFLIWFGSIMGAFQAQRSCAATYTMMQKVIQQYLTPQEAALFLPIWQLCQEVVSEPAYAS